MRSAELVSRLGGDALAQAVVDAFAARPRFSLYDFGGEVESSIESGGSARRLHAAYALADAFDVAGRVFPKRQIVDRVRAVVTNGRPLDSVTGMVGAVLDGDRPRAKLYVARGERFGEDAMRVLARDVGQALAQPELEIPAIGRLDVIAVECEVGGRLTLKIYLTFDDPDAADSMLINAADRERLRDIFASGPPRRGRCPVMVTWVRGRASAVQARIDPDALERIAFAPRCPPGTRPTYVSFRLRPGGGQVTTYFVLPGRPLDAQPPAEAAPEVRAGREEPKAIDISIGEHCDNDCRFCVNATVTRAPFADGRAIRRVITRCGKQGYKRLSFLGGEPTLHGDLVKIVLHAYRSGFEEVMLVTNGRRFADPSFAEAIRQAGVRRALFLFVSHRAGVHDSVTRRPGSHAQALAGLVEAQRVGIDVGVNVPITSENVAELCETGEFFAERRVRSLAYLYLAAYGNVLANPDVLADYDAASHSLVRVCDRLGKRVTLNIDNFPFCLLVGREEFIVGEMANPWREVAYPSGGVTDVASYFRFKKRRLPQCEGCRWDRACGGIQERPSVALTT